MGPCETGEREDGGGGDGDDEYDFGSFRLDLTSFRGGQGSLRLLMQLA